jgi:hypothetical protein
MASITCDHSTNPTKEVLGAGAKKFCSDWDIRRIYETEEAPAHIRDTLKHPGSVFFFGYDPPRTISQLLRALRVTE